MKKVICVAAAFLMVGGVATVASAEVDLSGSARARFRTNDSGIQGTSAVTKWDSRVRVKIHAKTEGGGYVKARVRFLDGTWGTGGDYTANAKGDYNVWSDYAFVGFKTGKLDFAGGKMPASFSAWFLDDDRRDRFRVLYKDGGLALAYTYDMKVYEFAPAANQTVDYQIVDTNGNLIDAVAEIAGASYDGDKVVHGITYRQKFSDAVSANLRVVYVVDDTVANDKSGMKWSANVAMNFGGNNIVLEQSWKDGATAGQDDDQMGGYAEWNATFGSITPTVRVGYTMDGFLADATFGWLMIGGDLPSSQAGTYFVGMGGDTMFLGLSSKFQTSEKLSFTGNLVFLDIDDNGNSVYGETPVELSAQARYQVGKGVELVARTGYLTSDSDVNDDAFTAYGKMEVSF